MIDPDRADLPFEAVSSFDDHFVLDGDSAVRAQVTMTLYPSTDTPEPKGYLATSWPERWHPQPRGASLHILQDSHSL